MGEAWIIDAVRTPRGKGRKDVGALVQTHPQELMATALRALAARNALDPHDVDDVVVGCVSQAGDQGACIARNAVLLAQWPQEVTGVSLNRFCGSGLAGREFRADGRDEWATAARRRGWRGIHVAPAYWLRRCRAGRQQP